MSEYEDFDDEGDVPICITEAATAAVANLLPEKSKHRYEKEYDTFKKWCITKKVKKTSEDVLLAYMTEANKKYKSSTIWSVYSMLRSMLLVKENVNISKFSKLKAYRKRASVGYQAKKSRVFSRNEVDDFLLKASDDTYLMMKVALIVGLAGGCRCSELAKMTLDDIDDKGNVLMVNIPYSKTYKARRFIVIDGNQQINLSLYRKYLALRPAHTPHRRLFVNYKKGKCSVQAVGIHTIGTIPSKVATFLGLPNCTEYTGHCLRRTSATLLVDAGGDISDLKRHGGWVSSGVAEGYIAESTENKRETARKIQGGMLCERSNKTADHNELSISGDSITGTEENTVAISSSTKAALSGINVSNVQNTNININIYN